MAVGSRQLLGALNCWRLAKWSRICCLLCLCQDAGRPGWFLFLREDGLGLAEGGSPWQQPCCSPLLSAGWRWQWQAGIGAILLAGLVSSAPFQESLVAAGSSCRAQVLAVTCSGPLPSSGKGDADPLAHWGLLHGGLLPL